MRVPSGGGEAPRFDILDSYLFGGVEREVEECVRSKTASTQSRFKAIGELRACSL